MRSYAVDVGPLAAGVVLYVTFISRNVSESESAFAVRGDLRQK